MEERDRNCTLVLIRCFDLRSLFPVGALRMAGQVGVRANPVAVLGGYMLDCVTFLVNMQQWALLQSEQQYRTQA